jgi:beta-lactamase class A
MTEWTTIRVRQDAKDAAAERKPDGITWSEFVGSEEYDPEVDTAALVADLKAELPGAVAEELEGRLR